MRTYIAFFRGINVGGHNILPMKKLTTLLENIGLKNVKTYIQSGNVIFRSEEIKSKLLSRKISNQIKKHFGFEPSLLIIEVDELAKAVKSNPFPDAGHEPKTLHLIFLLSVAKKPDLKALGNVKKQNERFKLKDNVFFLHAPDGLGRSKLAASAEKLLGVPMTGRNWRTVCTILDMARGID